MGGGLVLEAAASVQVLCMDDVAIYRNGGRPWRAPDGRGMPEGWNVDLLPIAPAMRWDLSPHELGRRGEELAATLLEMDGWDIVERNWVCPWGEADIIAYEEGRCVMVEVKSRMATSEAVRTLPELAVGSRKQRRYAHMASCYMAAEGLDLVRFDVMAVSVVPGHSVQVCHYRDAFGGDA
jgi:putative endonuclease